MSAPALSAVNGEHMKPETSTSREFVVHRDGRPATSEDLAGFAFAGHAHFTVMQVRGGLVRGLDLHLDRLRAASTELFGRALPDEQVRTYLRAAVQAGPADMTLTATTFSPEGEWTLAPPGAEPEMLIRTAPPYIAPAGPLALAVVEHERYLPDMKHVGEVAKTHLMRRAVAEGFDDAAFVDRRGRLSEASIWNLAFWDGSAVVWPKAEMLIGTTMGIVRRQLEALRVSQREEVVTPADLPNLAGAVVMNSATPGVAVHRIGSVELPEAAAFVRILHDAYCAEQLTTL